MGLCVCVVVSLVGVGGVVCVCGCFLGRGGWGCVCVVVSLVKHVDNKKPFRSFYIFKHVLKNTFVLFI